MFWWHLSWRRCPVCVLLWPTFHTFHQTRNPGTQGWGFVQFPCKTSHPCWTPKWKYIVGHVRVIRQQERAIQNSPPRASCSMSMAPGCPPCSRCRLSCGKTRGHRGQNWGHTKCRCKLLRTIQCQGMVASLRVCASAVNLSHTPAENAGACAVRLICDWIYTHFQPSPIGHCFAST